MAQTDYQDASPDYADQIRQRILAQLSPDQAATPNDAVMPTTDTPSPDFAAPNVPAPGNRDNEIQGYYSQFLGRNATGADLSAWSGESSLGNVMHGVANSPEADAYNRSHQLGNYAQLPTAPAPASVAPVAASPSPSINGGTSGWQDQIRQLLMQRLQAAQQPVDPNSPEIAATVGAAKDQLSRQSDLERNALAERLYGQGGGGLNTNALTQQIQQSNEKQGTALGSLKATLLMNAYNQKHSELQNDLQLAVQSGDAESARSIQMAIAQLQAAVQREGLGVNLAEFQKQLDQNAVMFAGR